MGTCGGGGGGFVEGELGCRVGLGDVVVVPFCPWAAREDLYFADCRWVYTGCVGLLMFRSVSKNMIMKPIRQSLYCTREKNPG